jgi:homoserine kinase
MVYQRLGVPVPQGLHITCRNSIPLGSGLGSSASAALIGLLGANGLLGNPISRPEILRMASEIEGHPDNAAAALLGGLVVVISQEGEPITRRFDLSMLQAALVTPRFDLPTHAARAALPQKVSMQDAVFNLGRTALVVEALRSGDLDLLGQVMQDRLHQPYRLPLIPGAAEALQAARTAGAKAAAISGAGPSLIAFGGQDLEAVAQAMQAAFMQAGLACRRAAVLNVSNQGALIYSAA